MSRAHKQTDAVPPLGAAPGSATERRMQLARMDRAGIALTLHPEGQAEAIAMHYVALANTARDLLELLKMRDAYGRRTGDADEAIAYLVGEIKCRHADDFGLPLEWPNGKADRRDTTNTDQSKGSV